MLTCVACGNGTFCHMICLPKHIVETEESRNEIAEQLSRINEQLVIKSRRTKKIIKVICIILLIPVVFIVLAIILVQFFMFDTDSGYGPVEEIGYEEYEDIEYDEIIEE